MNDDEILTALADRNPVRDAPGYDRAAEEGLQQLLNRIHADRARNGRARRGSSWFTTWRAAGVGIGVIALVAAALFVVRQPSGSPEVAAGPAATTRPSSTTQPSSTARFPAADASTPVDLVVDRSTLAITSATDYILEGDEVQYLSNGLVSPSSDWQDQTDTLLSRITVSDGADHLQLDTTTFRADGVLTTCAIDYRKRQYAEKVETGTMAPVSQSAVIAQDLRNGQDTILGTSVINGRTVLHLSNDEPTMNREIWVDPTSYLPVRMTAHGSFGSYVINYTWIPRGPASDARTFDPQIPAGFTKVDKIIG